MSAHRYWRVTSTARDGGGSTWGCSEIDIWESLYGPSALARPGWTLSVSGTTTGDAARLVDGEVGSANQWVSDSAATTWIAFDFGLGNAVEIHRVLFWRNSTGGAATVAGDVQYSDDGSTWTTAWSYSGIGSPASERLPAFASNSGAPANPAPFPLELRFANGVEYFLDAGGEVFSDDGITPIEDGDPVYRINNKGDLSGRDDFVQPTLALRPVWRASGALGLPYLDCDGSMHFEDVAFAQPSGILPIRPWAAYAVVRNPSRGGENPFWGSTVTNGGKAGFHLRPGVTDAEIYHSKTQSAGGNYTTDTRLIGAFRRARARLWRSIDLDHQISTNASNFASGAVSAANVLWNDGLSGDPSFEGELYALLTLEMPDPASGGDQTAVVDHYTTLYWLWAKYVVGFASDVETVNPSAGNIEFIGLSPSLIIDQFMDPVPGSLVLTGGVPSVVLDELIEPGAGALELTGGMASVFSGITLEPAAGSLVITGLKPIVTTFQFVASSQAAVVALADTDREARSSLFAAVALAEIVPQANASQMGFIALAEVIPPVAASQQAVVLVASGEPCVTRRAQFWTFYRTDGVVLGFTSHDTAITIDDVLYRPCDSLTPSASSSQAEVGQAGDMELAGIIASDAISAEDLQAGLYDDAYVEAIYQSWEDPTDTVRVIMAGWLGGVSHGEDGFRAEVIGPGGRLSQRPLTQMYTPACRWKFGDARCGVDIDALGLSGTVVSSITRGDFTATVTGVPGSAQYSSGRVRWLTGANAGAITEVKAFNDSTGRIILWAPAPFRPSAGDTFDLLPGCDQLRETCRDVYANIVNFGGFPDVPGEDAIVETPPAKY